MAANVRKINWVVTAILSLYLGLYFNAVYCVILPWMGHSTAAVMNLVGISYTSFVGMYLYIVCVFVDPGKVPEDWEPDAESEARLIQVKKKTGAHRFCQKCQAFKPPRCHHCRICQRCILRMDHHCPWVNNCIGHRNYRAFISFLIFLLLALLHNICLLTLFQHQSLNASLQDEPDGVSDSLAWNAVQVVALVLSIVLWLAVLGLFLWHLSLIASNKTTIEYHEGVNAKLLAAKHGKFWRHPYDLGLGANFITLFGRARWKWLFPFTQLEGDGLHHRTVIE